MKIEKIWANNSSEGTSIQPPKWWLEQHPEAIGPFYQIDRRDGFDVRGAHLGGKPGNYVSEEIISRHYHIRIVDAQGNVYTDLDDFAIVTTQITE